LDSPVYESRSSIFENPTESDGPSTKFPHFAPPHVVSPVLENDGVKHLTLKQPDPFFQPMNLGNYPDVGRPPCHSYYLAKYFSLTIVFLRYCCFRCPR
jgi:hypothetical protein